MSQIPFRRVNWITSSFLIGTFLLAITAVPFYIWHYGLDLFQILFYVVMVYATGMSITLGYHRLYAHRAFQAHWSVRLFTLLFGAAAFENSAVMWSSEHRRHHKHVDHDDDPYDISKGFFWAHIGWLLFKIDPSPPFDNVPDVKSDKLAAWQHRHIHLLAVGMGLVFPAVVGYLWNGGPGALGGFLIGGVARLVTVQHATFFINSLCHTVGNRPYSTRCSARDSAVMAFLTFGEGYHNYHHEFQHDYRNGVKVWQWDPTKWAIWSMSKLGLTRQLRRVSDEKILDAQMRTKEKLAPANQEEVSAPIEIPILRQMPATSE